MKTQALILFLRVPEKGQVKTRLCRSMDEGLVLELYKAFVLDMIALLKPVNRSFLFFTPADKKEKLIQWLGKKYRYHDQQGDDIGQKMAHAFETVFCKGFDRAILIGTDIPEIDQRILDLAAHTLETKDAVIGPSRDGGYYLIGLNREMFSPSLFSQIPWSTSQVLDQTLKIFKARSIEYSLIEQLSDIDSVQDFIALKNRVAQGQKTGFHTQMVLNACDV